MKFLYKKYSYVPDYLRTLVFSFQLALSKASTYAFPAAGCAVTFIHVSQVDIRELF